MKQRCARREEVKYIGQVIKQSKSRCGFQGVEKGGWAEDPHLQRTCRRQICLLTFILTNIFIIFKFISPCGSEISSAVVSNVASVLPPPCDKGQVYYRPNDTVL